MKEKQIVHVGTFGQPQGLKGDVKINIFTSSFDSFKILKRYFIENNESVLIFENLRQVGKKIIGSIKNCKDRNAALLFRGKKIFTFRDNFPKSKENEFYVIDLIGCEVFDLKKNILGIIKDIQNYGAGDLIEIKNNNNKIFYIPMNKENLVNIDLVKKNIIVNPIEGILE